MATSRSTFVPIDRPGQLRALASPLRQELLDVLEAAGPSSIADLAARLGRAADSLYFHVRRLLKVGLVVAVAPSRRGRHTAARYDVVGRPLRIDRAKARPADQHAIVGGILRLAGRDHRRALGHAHTVTAGPGRNHWGGRARGWLNARELATANTLLERLVALVRDGRPGKGRQPIALSWVLAPTPPGRRARTAGATATAAP